MKKEKLTFHELEKLAEQLATLKSENRSLFQTLFTDNRTIHLIIDKETSTIAKANKAACNFYGYSLDEITGMNLSQINILTENEIKQEIAKINDNDLYIYFFKHKLKNGEIRDVGVYTEQIEIESKQLLYSTIFDVTRQKEIERELNDTKRKAEESEQQFKAIFNNLQDAYFETDFNGKFININATAPKMYGYESVEEMLNMPALNFYANEKVRAEMISLLSSQRNITDFICEGKRKDGTAFWVSMNVQFKYDEDGKIAGTVGVVRDITERKQTEIRLAESEARYSKLLYNLEAGIVVHAPDTSIIMNNQKATEILGLSEDQMKGKVAIDAVWKFIHVDNTPLALDEYPVNKIIKTLQPIKNQILGVHQPRKKEIVWATVNGFPEFDNKGEISEIIISFIDITKHKIAEQEMIFAKERAEESEEQLRAIFENSKDAIGISHEGISVMVNKPFINMFGYDNENEIIGKSILTQIAPNEHNRIKEYYSKRYLEDKAPTYYEISGRRINGDVFPMEINVGTYIIKNDKYSVGIIRDITDRKNKELEIQRKMKELQWHFDIAMQRELKMVELKNEINELAIRHGESKRYGI